MFIVFLTSMEFSIIAFLITWMVAAFFEECTGETGVSPEFNFLMKTVSSRRCN